MSKWTKCYQGYQDNNKQILTPVIMLLVTVVLILHESSLEAAVCHFVTD